MTMHTTNGSGPREATFERDPYGQQEGHPEDEWNEMSYETLGEEELQETSYEMQGEDEWTETGMYATPETSYEDEWNETMPEALGEDEWTETGMYALPETSYEGEWNEAALYGNPYANQEDEADQFLPFLLPLAAKALPAIAKIAMPAVKSLIPAAKKMVGGVVKNVLGRAIPRGGSPARPVARRVSRGPVRRPALPAGRSTMPPVGQLPPSSKAAVVSLVRQLNTVLGIGEREAAELEAQLFGANEFEGELAGNELAHEAALTEVLAAEAAHTESESEAEALLGTTLPITIRVMGAQRTLRPVMPTLIQANTRLVRSMHNNGPAGRQLLRTVPTIQRRVVSSLRAMRRAGRPMTPDTVAQVMAGQAARVLSSGRLCGRALIRNTALRQGTVAPVNRTRRRRQQW